MIKIKSQIVEKIKKKDFTVLDARSKNRFLGTEPEPRPGIKSGSIEGSKSVPLSEIVNLKDNTKPINVVIDKKIFGSFINDQIRDIATKFCNCFC